LSESKIDYKIMSDVQVYEDEMITAESISTTLRKPSEDKGSIVALTDITNTPVKAAAKVKAAVLAGPPSSCINVCARIRPTTSETTENTIFVLGSKKVQTIPPASSKTATAKEFTYSKVFGPETTQSSVYDATTAPLVQELVGKG
jgi:hypothetical protein